MIKAARLHHQEYFIEAFCLGMFMVSACVATAFLEHPASPLCVAIPNPAVRRGLIGMAMGLTAMALIYSPWGRRSGAHMNPSVTLAFWRLGKIQTIDAACYVMAQFIGGWLGVMVSALLLRSWIAAPSVDYIITVPGPAGIGVAWAAEFAISFLLMTVVLVSSNHKRLAPWTGIFAGLLVATYILIEAPLSGMSMNPARTFGSALPAGHFQALWIYFTAPPLGMLGAAELYKILVDHPVCAKLAHDPARRCIFCGRGGSHEHAL